jgi:hypothetical protein
MKCYQFISACMVTLLMGSSLVAQTVNPGQLRVVKPQEGETAQSTLEENRLAGPAQSNDQIVARLLEISNKEQVLLARYGREKVSHDAVKTFAAMLEKDHQSCLEKVRTISEEVQSKGSTPIAGTPRSVTATPRSRPINSADSGPQQSSASDSRSTIGLVPFHEELSAQCLSDSKEWLDEKEGMEIDKCFVGMQVANHLAMKSRLTVMERYASGELDGLIKQVIAKNDEHLLAAIDLMTELADSNSRRDASETSK